MTVFCGRQHVGAENRAFNCILKLSKASQKQTVCLPVPPSPAGDRLLASLTWSWSISSPRLLCPWPDLLPLLVCGVPHAWCCLGIGACAQVGSKHGGDPLASPSPPACGRPSFWMSHLLFPFLSTFVSCISFLSPYFSLSSCTFLALSYPFWKLLSPYQLDYTSSAF